MKKVMNNVKKFVFLIGELGGTQFSVLFSNNVRSREISKTGL